MKTVLPELRKVSLGSLLEILLGANSTAASAFARARGNNASSRRARRPERSGIYNIHSAIIERVPLLIRQRDLVRSIVDACAHAHERMNVRASERTNERTVLRRRRVADIITRRVGRRIITARVEFCRIIPSNNNGTAIGAEHRRRFNLRIASIRFNRGRAACCL